MVKFLGITFGSKKMETREAEFPDKVYIEKEGDYKETSYDEPAHLADQINNLIYGEYSSRNFIELFYCLPEIFAPVHEIASRVSDCNWQLKREWNDEVDYNNSDFKRLFAQPNPLMAMKAFVYQAVCYEILTGKNLFYFNNSDIFEESYKKVIAWWNLPAHRAIANINYNFDPYTATDLSDFINYWKCSVNNKTRKFETKDILPILNMSLENPTNVNKIKSYLLGADKPIKNLIPVYAARGIIYIKRGAMGFLVSAKKDADGTKALTPSEKRDVRKEVNNQYGLTRGKDTIGVTDQPMEFIKTSMSIAEMLPFDETAADAIAIYKVLRVPRHLAPLKDSSTFANADADMKSFYDDVIIPMAKRFAQAWTNYFKFDRRYIDVDFSHIGILKDDEGKKSISDMNKGTMWLTRWSNSVCSLNEWIVANDGAKGTGPMFEKKLLEMTPEELVIAQSIINIKKPTPTTNDTSATDKAAKA